METPPRVVPYPLRMPDELRTRLEEAAKAGSRSLHAEIVQRLEASFERKQASHTQAGGPAPASEALQLALKEAQFTAMRYEVAAFEAYQMVANLGMSADELLESADPSKVSKTKVDYIVSLLDTSFLQWAVFDPMNLNDRVKLAEDIKVARHRIADARKWAEDNPTAEKIAAVRDLVAKHSEIADLALQRAKLYQKYDEVRGMKEHLQSDQIAELNPAEKHGKM